MSTTPPPPPGSPPPPPASPDPGREPSFGGAAIAGSVGVGPGGRTIARAWKRIAARFFDILVTNLVGFVIIRAMVGESTVAVADSGEIDAADLLVASLITLLVTFVWEAVATKMIGGTPMKRAFGMRVVQAESGAEVEWRHAVIRWGTLAIWSILPIPILSSLGFLLIVIVSLVFMFTKPLRQAVWDRTAKTVVIDG